LWQKKGAIPAPFPTSVSEKNAKRLPQQDKSQTPFFADKNICFY